MCVIVSLCSGFLNFQNQTFIRSPDIYGNTDYQLLRALAADTDLSALSHENTDTYATNITNHVLSIGKECIPNKVVRIRPADPPWLTSYTKGYMNKVNVKELIEKPNVILLFTRQKFED